MSTLNTTTTNTRPTTLNNTTDVGKSYFEKDSNKIVVWDGTGWVFYQNDGVISPFLANSSSVTLDGLSDYMTAPNTALNFYTGGGSVSAWVRPTSVTDSQTTVYYNRPIINKGNTYIAFSINESGVPNWYFFNGGEEITASTAVSTTDWTHICWTWSTSGCAIYVNGTSEVTSSSTPANLTSAHTSSVFYVGRPYGGSYFGGLIDELATFDYELNSTQIESLYTSQTGANNTPANITDLDPVNWWRMGDYSGDTSGTTVTDQGTKGTTRSDLTFQNGAAFSTTVPRAI